MAKLKAPLMSLGASGALGKSLVFFPWKGLDVVREYVIPANPQSDPQMTQRGYLSSLVTMIHAAMADATHPLNETDKSAYALLGSCEATPRTWFNTAVKQGIDRLVDALCYGIFKGGIVTPSVDALTLELWWTASVNPTSGRIWWGTSKTAMLNSANADPAAGAIVADATGLISGTKYYLQWKADAPDLAIGLASGIYYGTAG